MSGGSGRGGRSIDPKVREAALEAARRHGIPVGDWLTDAIGAAAPVADSGAPTDEASEAVSPLHSRRIAEALERLASRIEAVEQRNNLTVVSLDRQVLGLAARLDDTEIGAREEALRMLAALGDVKSGQDALSTRLEAAERQALDGAGSAALKAVDKQVNKLGQQVFDLDSRTATESSALRQAVDAVSARADEVETRARELAARFTEVTSGVSGAESQAKAAIARADEMAAQARKDIAAVKTSSDQTANAVRGQLASMESRLAEMNNKADAALADLGAKVSGLSDRFSEVERGLQTTSTVQNARIDDLQAQLARDTSALKSEVTSRLSAATAAAADALAQARNEISGEIAGALDSVRSEDMEAALSDVNRRIAAAERRQAQTIEAVSIEIRRISEAVDKRIKSVEALPLSAAGVVAPAGAAIAPEALDAMAAQVAAADARTREDMAKLATQVEKRLETNDAHSAAVIEQISQQLAGLADKLTARQDKLAVDIVEQVRQVDQRAQDRIADVMNAVGARLAEVAERSDKALAPVQTVMAEISGRLTSLEERAFAAPQVTAFDAPLEPLRDAPPLSPSPADVLRAPIPEPDPQPTFAAEPAPDYAPEPAAPPPASARRADEFDVEDPMLDLEPPPPPANAGAEEDFWNLDPDDADPASAPEPAAPETAKRKSGRADYIETARRAATPAVSAEPEAPEPAAKPVKPAKPPKAEKVKPAPISAPAAEKPAAGLRGLNRGVVVAAGAIGVAAVAGFVLLNGGFGGQKANAPAEQAAASAKGATTPAQPNAQPPAQTETLEQAAARGEAAAQYELGLAKLQAQDVAAGLAALRQAADQGLAAAQYRLAKMYERGDGVERDLRESWRWTELAAKGGNRKAMYDLGVFYARGEGAPFNEAEAFRWFRQAAEYGVSDGQFNLAVLYQQGRGAKPNPKEALFWFNVAANAGDAEARARTAVLESRIPQGEIAQIRARAEAFKPKPFDPRANGVFDNRTWPVPAGIEITAP